MNPPLQAKQALNVGDQAVKKATGRTWPQWFAVLDQAGAKKMAHQEIVALVHERHGAGPWWQQMVTVGYEQARGLRKKHEKPGGFEISVCKTVAAPVAAAFDVWADESRRALWLADAGLAIRTATRNKSIRITWVDGKTSVAVNFSAKGAGKSQVVAQHSKLASAAAASRMKAYWGAQLGRLQGLLETSR